MESKDKDALLLQAITQYGEIPQMIVAIEEMSDWWASQGIKVYKAWQEAGAL